jgi:hypothetical protein
VNKKDKDNVNRNVFGLRDRDMKINIFFVTVLDLIYILTKQEGQRIHIP